MKKTAELVFTGDIGFDKYMDGKWSDSRLLEGEVSDFLKSGNHLIVNVEGPLSEGKKMDSEGNAAKLLHTMNPEVADFLDGIGADVWNICNNHIMDAGREGIEDTLRIAQEHGVSTLGAGRNIGEARKPVIFDEAGGIGLIGVGYQRACRKADTDTPGCFSWSDMEGIRDTINEVKKTCRWCIIVAHGGEEFTALPSRYTRDRYLEYLDMGADVVVAHHPHVPMNYEIRGEKAIFYSLGNFIFDTDYQRSQFNTEKGILLRLTFTETDFNFEAFGIKINRDEERIEKAELPKIFENVEESEYNKLEALAAAMFIENTQKQWRYLKPEKFENASPQDWYDNFYEPLRSGRVPGEVLDFQIIYPLAQKAAEGAWKDSKLENVKEFILEQMNIK